MSQEELRPLTCCCTEEHDWGLSFTGLMLFADKAIAIQLFISWTSKTQTTSLICLVLCSYTYPDLTLVCSPDRVGFCSQNSWTVLKHKKLCRDLRERWWLEQWVSHLLSTFSHCAHAWQGLAAESKRRPYTINLCDTHSKCHFWECQQPPPCTAQLPTACKKNPYQTTSLITSLLVPSPCS